MNWDKFIFDKLKNKSLIKPGWTTVDVGAYQGLYTTFLMNNVGANGKVYAFELSEKNFKILTNKFSKNENVYLENYAISNIDGKINFYKKSNLGNCAYNVIGYDTNTKLNLKPIGTTSSIKLDSYFDNAKKINFLKMDIEGAEIIALKGMENIINNVDFMLIECHIDKDWDELREVLLDQYEFECYNFKTDEKITKNSIRPYQCFCENKNLHPTNKLYNKNK